MDLDVKSPPELDIMVAAPAAKLGGSQPFGISSSEVPLAFANGNSLSKETMFRPIDEPAGLSADIKTEVFDAAPELVEMSAVDRNYEAAISHISRDYPEAGLLRCTHAGCAFATADSNHLMLHLRAGHRDTQPYKLRVFCSKSFTQKNHLERHELIHLGCKPFKCAQCNFAYGRRDKLREHMRVTHGTLVMVDRRAWEWDYKCADCPFFSHRHSDFIQHVVTVHQPVIQPVHDRKAEKDRSSPPSNGESAEQNIAAPSQNRKPPAFVMPIDDLALTPAGAADSETPFCVTDVVNSLSQLARSEDGLSSSTSSPTPWVPPVDDDEPPSCVTDVVESLFRSRIRDSNSVDSSIEPGQISEPVTDDDTTALLRCAKCPFATKNPSQLGTHTMAHAAPTGKCASRRRYKCGVCDWSSDRATVWVRHMALHGQRLSVDEAQRLRRSAASNKSTAVGKRRHGGAGDAQQLYRCAQCAFTSTQSRLLANHERAHSNRNRNPFTCDAGDWTNDMPVRHGPQLTTVDQASRRRRFGHGQTAAADGREVGGVYRCPKCPFRSANLGTWTVHLRAHSAPKHRRRSYYCDVCDWSSCQIAGYVKHMALHGQQLSTQQAFVRARCHRDTAVKSEPSRTADGNESSSASVPLKTQSDTANKPSEPKTSTAIYRCLECPFATTHATTFTIHVRTHSVVPTENASRVQQSLTPAPHASIRQKSHKYKAGPYAYRCTKCPFTTGHAGNFESHKKAHSATVRLRRPYSCDVCDWSTTTLVDYVKHMALHGQLLTTQQASVRARYSRRTTGYLSVKSEPSTFGIEVNNDSVGHLQTQPDSANEPLPKSEPTSAQQHPISRGPRKATGAPYRCAKCPFTTRNSWQFRTHQRAHSAKDKIGGKHGRPYKCDVCEHWATDMPGRYVKHMALHGHVLTVDEARQRCLNKPCRMRSANTQSLPPVHSIPYNNSHSPAAATNHVHHSKSQSAALLNHPKPPAPNRRHCYACTVCYWTGTSAARCVRHMARCHGQQLSPLEARELCLTSRGRMQSEALPQFDSAATTDGVLRCPDCDWSTLRRSSYVRHRALHAADSADDAGGDRLHCDRCPFTCRQSVVLINHMKAHNSTLSYAPYACDVCDWSSAYTAKYVDHMALHGQYLSLDEARARCLTSRARGCDRPGDGATANSEMDSSSSHRAAPADHHNRLQRCTRCPFTCSQPHNMASHRKAHAAGARQRHWRSSYACDVCDWSSNDVAGYARHMQLHGRAPKTAPRVYSCAKCPFTTIVWRELARHERAHSATTTRHRRRRSYACDVCDWSGVRCDAYVGHMALHGRHLTEDEARRRKHGSRHAGIGSGSAAIRTEPQSDDDASADNVPFTEWDSASSQSTQQDQPTATGIGSGSAAIRTEPQSDDDVTADAVPLAQQENGANSELDQLPAGAAAKSTGKLRRCRKCPYTCRRACHLAHHMKAHNSGWWWAPYKCDVCDWVSSVAQSYVSHMALHGRTLTEDEARRRFGRPAKGVSSWSAVRTEPQSDDVASAKDLPFTQWDVQNKANFDTGVASGSAAIRTEPQTQSDDHPSADDLLLFTQWDSSSRQSIQQNRPISTDLLPAAAAADSYGELLRCAKCPFTCQRVMVLANHIKAHNSTLSYAPYKCDVCDWAGSIVQNYVKHMALHDQPITIDQARLRFVGRRAKDVASGSAAIRTEPQPDFVSANDLPFTQWHSQNNTNFDTGIGSGSAAIRTEPQSDDGASANDLPFTQWDSQNNTNFDTGIASGSAAIRTEPQSDDASANDLPFTQWDAQKNTNFDTGIDSDSPAIRTEHNSAAVHQTGQRHLTGDDGCAPKPIQICQSGKPMYTVSLGTDPRRRDPGPIELQIPIGEPQSDDLPFTLWQSESGANFDLGNASGSAAISTEPQSDDSNEDDVPFESSPSVQEKTTSTAAASPPAIYRCAKCPFTSRLRHSLSQHERQHSRRPSANDYQCDRCDYSASLRHITAHRKLHDNADAGVGGPRSVPVNKRPVENGRYAVSQLLRCDQCAFTSRSADALARHCRKHTELANGQQQPSTSALPLAPLTASVAQSPFDSSSVNRTQERFECDQCAYGATVAWHMGKHLLAHTGQRPSRFVWTRELRRRVAARKRVVTSTNAMMAVEHGRSDGENIFASNYRRYQCDMCLYTSPSWQQLADHMGEMHGRDPASAQAAIDVAQATGSVLQDLPLLAELLKLKPKNRFIFACKQCRFSTEQSREYIEHQLQRHASQPFRALAQFVLPDCVPTETLDVSASDGVAELIVRISETDVDLANRALGAKHSTPRHSSVGAIAARRPFQVKSEPVF